jgi:hypothetical protein
VAKEGGRWWNAARGGGACSGEQLLAGESERGGLRWSSPQHRAPAAVVGDENVAERRIDGGLESLATVAARARGRARHELGGEAGWTTGLGAPYIGRGRGEGRPTARGRRCSGASHEGSNGGGCYRLREERRRGDVAAH